MSSPLFRKFILALLLLLPVLASAALPPVDARVRYMALGDSLAAGYKAMPAIKGYAYQLYLTEVFGLLTETVFDNASVPGATSDDLLNFQLPQVQRFRPNVVTISIGGNDMLSLLGDAPPADAQVLAVLNRFGNNLGQTLVSLCSQLPTGGQIYLHDIYSVPQIPPTEAVIPLFNATLVRAVDGVRQRPECGGKTIAIADVFNAFEGEDGLLLIERFEKKGFENTVEVHPTNQGHRAIENAFRALLGRAELPRLAD